MTIRDLIELIPQDDDEDYMADCAARWPDPYGWSQLYNDDDEDTT